jgi:hypothetical protein
LILLITLTYVQIIFSFETTDNTPECLSKIQLFQILKRDRRASISRSYFHHWHHTRDNTRYTPKKSLAFSPRLGKRANDLDQVLRDFADQLHQQQIDIIYEDSTKICLSKPISDTFLQDILGQVDVSRRSQDEHEKEETHGRQTMGKHPVLFRYRLG